MKHPLTMIDSHLSPVRFYLRLSRLGVLSVLLVSLLGCKVGPDYVRPPLELGAQFREASGWQPVDPAMATRSKGTWWEMFGDATLNGLMQQLNESNLSVAQSEAQYRQAVAVLRSSQAALMPTLSVNGGMTGIGGTAVSSTGAAASNDYDVYKLSATASWTLDIWGSVRRNVEGQTANRKLAAANLAGARLTAQSTLALTYMQLRTLDETARVLSTSVQSYERSLTLTQNKYNAGVANPGDVATATTQLESTRAQLIDTEQQRMVYQNAIAVLLARPPSSFNIKPEAFAIKPPTIPVGLPSTLLEQRPDIAGATMQVEAANAQVGVAVAAWFPALTLSATGGYQTTNFLQWITAPAQYWSLGPSIAQAIFDGGTRNALIDQNRAIFDAQTAAYRLTVLQALQQVDNAMIQLRVYDRELQSSRRAMESSKEAVRLAMNQYNQGLVDYLSVAVLQTSALNAESNYIGLLGSRLAASVNLVVALGGGWSMDKIEQIDKQGKEIRPDDLATELSSAQSAADSSNAVGP